MTICQMTISKKHVRKNKKNFAANLRILAAPRQKICSLYNYISILSSNCSTPKVKGTHTFNALVITFSEYIDKKLAKTMDTNCDIKAALSCGNPCSKLGLSARAFSSKSNVIGTCLEPHFGTKISTGQCGLKLLNTPLTNLYLSLLCTYR